MFRGIFGRTSNVVLYNSLIPPATCINDKTYTGINVIINTVVKILLFLKSNTTLEKG